MEEVLTWSGEKEVGEDGKWRDLISALLYGEERRNGVGPTNDLVVAMLLFYCFARFILALHCYTYSTILFI